MKGRDYSCIYQPEEESDMNSRQKLVVYGEQYEQIDELDQYGVSSNDFSPLMSLFK
jgi:hypothetical protein